MADIGHIATAYELEAINRLKSIVAPHPTIAPFAVGDRIYFQEEWCKGDWGTAFDDDIYFTKSTTPEAENIGWQPASTMPPQAAQYWFEIERVRVVQAWQLPQGMIRDSGLYVPDVESLVNLDQILPEKWNTAYPEQPWNSDRWIIGLDVRSIP